MDKKIIINVGRQFGSGGKSVAIEMGKMLSVPVYDYELLAETARESGLSTEFLSKSDETRNIWSLSNLNIIGDHEKFLLQSEVIRGIAAKGSAIFVGRAADYVLRDMDCLNVFICAPLEERVKKVCERMGISREQALTMIPKKDKGREEYYNLFTFQHWGVASNYHLCVDSSILGIEGTAQYIIDFLNKK